MPDLEKQRVGLVRRFVSGMRFPYAFLAMAAVFIADLLVPDVIPFLDEIGLGLLTALLAGWRRRREPVAQDDAKAEQSDGQ